MVTLSAHLRPRQYCFEYILWTLVTVVTLDTGSCCEKHEEVSFLKLYGEELVAICVQGHDGLLSDKCSGCIDCCSFHFCLIQFILLPHNLDLQRYCPTAVNKVMSRKLG